MKIKSITTADGWYRVSGKSVNAYILEEIAVWAVVEYVDINDDIIVGIPLDHFGVSGNEEDCYRVGIAGYVKESQTEIDSSGNRVLKKNEWQQLLWEE
ncbi:MAG: hypothetical protein J0G95_01435 [Rhizobiales bacterium]|nr:hypothetical protein [Hyphomicrobiales bacterium]